MTLDRWGSFHEPTSFPDEHLRLLTTTNVIVQCLSLETFLRRKILLSAFPCPVCGSGTRAEAQRGHPNDLRLQWMVTVTLEGTLLSLRWVGTTKKQGNKVQRSATHFHNIWEDITFRVLLYDPGCCCKTRSRLEELKCLLVILIWSRFEIESVAQLSTLLKSTGSKNDFVLWGFNN